MKTKLINNVFAAINEIEELLGAVQSENQPGKAEYELDSEHSQMLQATAENVLDELNRLKSRIEGA